MGSLLKLKEAYDTLSKKEKAVAKLILDFPKETTEMSIEQLALASGSSASSVVRLCKTIGVSGYKEMCRTIAAELAVTGGNGITYSDIRPNDSIEAIARSVAANNAQSIENTLSMMDFAVLEKTIAAMDAAKRIDFYGVGISGIVAMDANNKFLRINKTSMHSPDPHVQILMAATLMPGDVAVFISYSGETKDTLEAADLAKKAGATTIAITHFGKNSLSDRADINLHISTSEVMVRSGAMSSRISQLTIIDILYTAIASTNYEKVKPYLNRTTLALNKKRARPNE